MRRKSENKLSRNLVVGCCGLALRWIGCGECLVGLFRANPTQRNSFGPVAGLMLPTLSFCLQQLWSLLCLRHNCQVWEWRRGKGKEEIEKWKEQEVALQKKSIKAHERYGVGWGEENRANRWESENEIDAGCAPGGLSWVELAGGGRGNWIFYWIASWENIKESKILEKYDTPAAASNPFLTFSKPFLIKILKAILKN